MLGRGQGALLLEGGQDAPCAQGHGQRLVEGEGFVLPVRWLGQGTGEMLGPPCTERYARWLEGSASELITGLLLDQSSSMPLERLTHSLNFISTDTHVSF